MILFDIRKIFDFLSKLFILAIIFFVPIFFSFFIYTNNFFELPKIILFKILTLLLFLVEIFKILTQRVEEGGKISFKKYWILLIGITILAFFALQTIFFSINFIDSFFGLYDRQQGLAALFYYFLFLFLFLRNIRQRDLGLVLNAVIFSSLVVCLYGFMQKVGLDFINWSESATEMRRVFSTFGQPTFLASYLVLVVPISLYLFFKSEKIIKSIFYFLAFSIQVVCLILTYSFGGWIAFFFSLFATYLFLFLYKKKSSDKFLRKKIYLSSLFIVFTIVVASLFVFSKSSFLREKVASLRNWDNSTASARTIYWKASWSAIKVKPFFGYGLENQGNVLIKYRDKKWSELDFVNMGTNRAHNIFLDILLTTGFFGLTIFIVILAYIFRCLFQNWLKNRDEYLPIFFGIAILSLLFSMQFSFLTVTAGVYLSFFVAIIFLYDEKKENNLENKQTKKILEFAKKFNVPFLVIIVFIIYSLIQSNFNKLVIDIYYRELLVANLRNDFSNELRLYNLIKEKHPNYNFYDQQFLALMNDSVEKFEKPEENIKIIAPRIIDVINKIKSNSFSDNLARARAYALLSVVDKNSLPNSENLYEKLIADNSGFPLPYYELARLYQRNEKYEEAKKEYLEFLEVLPDYKNPSLNVIHRKDIANETLKGFMGLGDNELLRKKWLEAEKYYLEGLEIDKNNTLLNYKLGRLFYLKHDFNKAIWYNKKVADLDPNNYFYPYIIAQIYLEAGDKNNAKVYGERALNLSNGAKEVQEFLQKVNVSSNKQIKIN